MLDKKYEDILMGVAKALDYMNKNYIHDVITWSSIDGYRIMRLGGIEPDGTWFSKIDWLIDNGYIAQGKPMWCDMTDGYVETYKLTEKGNEYLKEMVGRE